MPNVCPNKTIINHPKSRLLLVDVATAAFAFVVVVTVTTELVPPTLPLQNDV